MVPDSRPASLSDREPGSDSEDPYEGVDIDSLPDWWAEAVAEFRAHGLRPYRPPRLADGELSPPVVDGLAAKYGVDVRFRGVDVRHGDDWALFVDGERVTSVSRERDRAGFTRFGMTSHELAAAVAARVGADPDDERSVAAPER